MSASPLPPPPNLPALTPATLLSLDAAGLVELINSEAKRDREAFDRLLKWFGFAATTLIAIATFFGYQSKHDVEATAAVMRAEARIQIQAEVSKETNEENIQKYINAAIEKRTEAQFQDAIAKAVGAQLETPERQKFLETAVQKQVDIWFAKHQNVLQTAAQRQVDILTEHVQNREKILKLGDAAVTPTPRSMSALRELQKLAKNSTDEGVKEAASSEISRVGTFWSNTYFVVRGDIKALDEKGLKPPYTTCDLLPLLHSSDWKDRARSIDFLMIRQEKGVPDAVLPLLNDDYLEVAVRAGRLFSLLSGENELSIFPDLDELHKWWAANGQQVNAKFKPLDCKSK